MPYAHSKNDEGRRHDLVEHLRQVAERASLSASAFGAGEIARYLGLWHDLGKFHPVFQRYLIDCEAQHRGHGPDHKAAGAHLAAEHLGPGAMLIQGHHGGLRDRIGFETWLADKIGNTATNEALKLARLAMPGLEPAERLTLPAFGQEDTRAGELFLRFLFSALVDADFLDTEAHFNPDRVLRRVSPVPMAELWERFQRDQESLTGCTTNHVWQVRHDVYQACLTAAEGSQGLYRLTVPTGGGKTRSAMAFALRHALRHNLDRVVVAVPFISITEQTADVYRGIFEDGKADEPVVLEHHSAAYLADAEEGDSGRANVFARLAAENWDARVVVTTTVQIFESLFSNQVGRTRKLHNLARAVVILDEAQSLPPHLLTPILDVLQELCARYGSTVVLSTATQPAFEAIPVFSSVQAKEIVPDSARFFDALRRVNYEWRTEPALAWPEVAELLRQETQALAVVNTKKDALALLDALDDPDALHLSTMLCGAHRRATITKAKRRLEAGKPCRLVSTQVIEAGVDLDFPLVLRALGPLDSIIQAAGRCNREGRLHRGRVIVFRAEGSRPPPGVYRTATDITESVLGGGSVDPDDPSASRTYFRRLFETVETDPERIQQLREHLDYPEVARRFRMIDKDTQSVVIPHYGGPQQRCMVRETLGRLRRGDPETRLLMRRLQPYLVNVYFHQLPRLQRQGLVSEVTEGVWEWHGAYHPVRGIGGVESVDPEALVF